jgi:hypothetical protein
MKQGTQHIMMLRPKQFGYDPETAESNAFQDKEGADAKATIQEQALFEFDHAVEQLRSFGIQLTVIEDTAHPIKPNAIFPNNWISFHDNRIVLYPMLAESRRAERRTDIIDLIKDEVVSFDEVIDYSGQELKGRFLESTGSIVFDYENERAYACLSPRTDEGLLRELCSVLKYEPVIFNARDAKGQLIYHTNVMMCLASKYAIICLDSIDFPEKEEVVDTLKSTGHQIIPISMEQVYHFAGNMLEVIGDKGQSFLVMSKAAYNSLNQIQIDQIRQYSEIIPIPIGTIEKYGGGSVRCMMCRVT